LAAELGADTEANMQPVLGIALGTVVALVGAWLLIVVIRRLLRTTIGLVVLVVLAIAALWAGVTQSRLQGQLRNHVAVGQRVRATSSEPGSLTAANDWQAK